MEYEEFNFLLNEGLKCLYKSDHVLLSRGLNINERTITHRLAMHLTYLFRDFDVDCEYNRMQYSNGSHIEGDGWKKTLNLKIDEKINDEDDEAKTVFPDIIIHKRRKPINLAVIEVKMSWKSGRKDFDFEKLRAYKKEFDYEYAVYLELNTEFETIEKKFF